MVRRCFRYVASDFIFVCLGVPKILFLRGEGLVVVEITRKKRIKKKKENPESEY